MASSSSGSPRRLFDDDKVMFCGPCLSEGVSVEANEICEDCCEYLCPTCVRYHRKFSATASHFIVRKGDTSQRQSMGAYRSNLFNIDRPIEKLADLHQTTREHKVKYSSLILAHCGDMNVKSKADTNDCYITGCCLLSSGNIVLADHENYSVKILDTKHHTILSEEFLDEAPWDVATISLHKIAVTVPKAQIIQCFDIEYGVLSKANILVENGECRGIAHHGGQLVVSYDRPSKVQILSLDGHILKSFKQDVSGVSLFLCPQYVTVSPNGHFFYVSDRDTFTITKMTFEGEIVATYEDHELCSPRGIVAKHDGTLIICNWRNHKLHLISSACEKVKILEPLSDDVLCPTAVCFCEDLHKLYVSRHWVGAHPNYVNNMGVFQFE